MRHHYEGGRELKVDVLCEAGYDEALLGLSLSFDSSPSPRVASRLAHKGGGESKFLESIVVWLDITAPRYWWQQFDTYRVGVTKQSQSTMHTILRRELTQEDFEDGCEGIILELVNKKIRERDFRWIKKHLPESFLQRRIVCTNYMVLQRAYKQRKEHKLPEWQCFFGSILELVDCPDFIREVL